MPIFDAITPFSTSSSRSTLRRGNDSLHFLQ
jgi:hypothetical protein